jgi:hypothetical protein
MSPHLKRQTPPFTVPLHGTTDVPPAHTKYKKEERADMIRIKAAFGVGMSIPAILGRRGF